MRTLHILLLSTALFVSACTGTAEVFSDNGGNDAATAADGGAPQGTVDAGSSLDANQPPPTGPVCGDGVAERGETCDGNCPAACDDGNACTNDVMSGDPATCDVVCSAEPIAACQNDDGCCPAACDSGNDNDCSASCGNDVLDPGETCDPPGSCPIGCDDGDACTTNVMTGSSNNCNVACSYTQVTSCVDDDGCCPSNCDSTLDNDCSPACGNGVVEQGELCDGNCGTCNDGDSCTADSSAGSAGTCDLACTNTVIDRCTDNDGCCPSRCNANNDNDCGAMCGNGTREAGEKCDGDCPTSCDDMNSCTSDSLVGMAAQCNAECVFDPITTCTNNDGCCAPGCNAANDNDCTAMCGNGVVEPGENCDQNCPSCDDGNACTTDASSGSAGTCDLTCTNTAIAACIDGDGCCAPGCDYTNDDDCSPICGNGVVEGNETCDGNCGTCNDGNSCTSDTQTGSAGTCNLVCTNTAITQCIDGDGCCAPGCNGNNDDDCSAVCGNGAIEGGEKCDGNCPTACDDQNSCTTNTLVGSAGMCSAECVYDAITTCTDGDGCCAPGCDANNDDDCAPMCGNGAVETGETCDGNCPAGCDDSNSCTTDSSSGSAGMCNLTCTNTAITTCTDGDGCCAPGCNANNDNDCPFDCADPASWPTAYDDFETEVVRLVNIERAAGANCGSRGTFAAAGPVTMQVHLQQAARCHSADMAENNYFSHTGINGSSFSQRCLDAGYTASPLGENIAAGYSTPAAVVTGWMNSDGHCANIMKANINEIGLGYYYKTGTQWTRYWTMVTGRR